EQTSVLIRPLVAVDRVVKLLPQLQVTWVTTYSGWIPDFTMCSSWSIWPPDRPARGVNRDRRTSLPGPGRRLQNGDLHTVGLAADCPFTSLGSGSATAPEPRIFLACDGCYSPSRAGVFFWICISSSTFDFVLRICVISSSRACCWSMLCSSLRRRHMTASSSAPSRISSRRVLEIGRA